MPRRTKSKSQKISQYVFFNSRWYKIILTALEIVVLLGIFHILVHYTVYPAVKVLMVYNSVLPCSADKPLMDRKGTCHSCDEADSVEVKGVTENCTLCPNRVLQGIENVFCALPCSADKPLMDRKGTCHSCDEADSVDVDGAPENCAVCDNRVVNGYYCALKCSADKPLMDRSGDCHSCDEVDHVDVDGVTENCAVCENRVVDDGYCILSECPADKPLRGSDDNCHSCNTTWDVYVAGVTGNCAVCENRKLKGGYCVLK